MPRHIAAVVIAALVRAATAHATTLPPNFQESTVFSGLEFPTVVRFASDGRIFIAEKSGLIKVYAGLIATTPQIFADLRPQVHDYWDRGLLGMVLDPAFPTRPYVYVLYALDRNPADPAAAIPTWGDQCPDPPGPTDAGCPVLGRVSRLNASAPWPVQSTEQVLLEGFPQQYPSHSVGTLLFGPEGALYVTGGEGASFLAVDYGQFGGSAGPGPGQNVPFNPFGDPPGPPGVPLTPPFAQGGALRSQSLRRPIGQPASLNGVVLRLNPDTGDALPDNPLSAAPDVNARRIIGFGLRNPFRMAMRPGTRELWIGDVGWTLTEEINVMDPQTGLVPNFGWPCYEGVLPQPGFQAAGLSSCQSLYAAGTAAPPFYSYEHPAAVTPGEGCPTGTSALSGLAFYTTGTYPAVYHGALFFTDWARRCIWAMLPDGTGKPNPGQIVGFASDMPGGSVNLERGPAGDIFYVDFDGGRVQRISYFGGNQPPTVVLTANPSTGPSPLLVQFDASGSHDPEGGALTFAWDLDDDGQFDDSTLPNPQWTFQTSGKHDVRVRVRDPQATTSIGLTAIYVDNLAPQATIFTPTSSMTWRVGQPFFFSGAGSDPEDGLLPPSMMRWTLRMQHCPASCHVHTIQTWAGFAAGSFVAPDHEYPSWLELELLVTDAGGRTATAAVALLPQTVAMTFASSPAGLVVAVGNHSGPTPFVRTLIVGATTTVSAPAPQDVNGEPYGFSSWSDGGAATHLVVAPAAPGTLSATFLPYADVSLTQVLSSDRAVVTGRVRSTLTIANAGPGVAPNVRVTATLPDGMALVSSAPPGVCATAGSSLTCNLGSLASTAQTGLDLVLRASRRGAAAIALTVRSNAPDADPSDNAATRNVVVRPVGDFNDDGHEDLMLQSSVSGTVLVIFMNGPIPIGLNVLTPDRGPDPNWRLGGVGDFSGDGRPDLFWRHQITGTNEIWVMNGVVRTSIAAFVTVPDTALSIQGAADFSGDGWPDILWRNAASGANAILTMNGTSPSIAAPLAWADSSWEILGGPDMTKDGKSDIVWRNLADGVTYVWILDGVSRVGISPLVGIPLASWRTGSFADLNGDDKPDQVYRDQTTGLYLVLFHDGLTVTGYALLFQADPSWMLIGPR